ncbi:MAG: sensor histidine kinase [Chloroflexi bacterium]|nr:sensor histidine kinase [Chloroflexota bacterium]
MQHVGIKQQTETDSFDRLNELNVKSHHDLDAIQRELTEISVLIKQSSMEVERLTIRGAESAKRLRDMQANIENYTRPEIQDTFTSAQEMEMKLFLMKGRLEQLEYKRQSLLRFREHLDACTRLVAGAYVAGSEASEATSADNGEERSSGVRQDAIGEIIQAQEDERRRIASRMHDGPVQSLTNLILRAEICERLLGRDQESARNELAGLRQTVTTTLQETRRFIFDLHPMILDDLGLIPTLRRYAESFTWLTRIPVKLSVSGAERRLPPAVETAFFRIVQEALGNASRHANPTDIRIDVELLEDSVRLSVEDNGSGFDVQSALASSRRSALGLNGMRERAQLVRGTIRIDSSPEKGSRVSVHVPTL